MKTVAFILLLLFSIDAKANNPYRIYLLSKISQRPPANNLLTTSKSSSANVICRISRCEIPKGNLFCRMEDKLTRATKVWIKIGLK